MSVSIRADDTPQPWETYAMTWIRLCHIDEVMNDTRRKSSTSVNALLGWFKITVSPFCLFIYLLYSRRLVIFKFWNFSHSFLVFQLLKNMVHNQPTSLHMERNTWTRSDLQMQFTLEISSNYYNVGLVIGTVQKEPTFQLLSWSSPRAK